ncbi:MAG: ferritin [Chitinophagales bacterium]|nr:ferritin [Chitinophagales bacterium]HMV15427.1 ferritin [Chitinophagales bacterium]HMW13844.1 ferritin [Chitinophagales bacterium]HMX61405.1 ferritin [Chitinophagales bacterium]HMY23837.1 ferritin [Chitinophagales bacterium]
MIIPKKVEKTLNVHLELEALAFFSYLAMASWCEKEGLEGCAKFFRKQSDEEHVHFMKFFDYINEVGGHAEVPPVKQPKIDFKDILEVCQQSLLNEQKVTKSIYNILKVTQQEDDHATEDFLQFFVMEQREEEVQFKRIIDKIHLIGKGPQSLYYIDKEFEKLVSAGNKDEKKAKG